ncbi:MAG: DUF192 domain-containing protein [Patescibacteria group bacterium]|nr:DUF192 domain-containing protein [Patescibacteria group bacterium]
MILNKKFLKYWHQYWHLGLLIIITSIIALAYVSWHLNAYKSVSIQAGTCSFIVDLADTPDKQYQGLSDRQELEFNQGMLFVFNEVKDKTFVMRNMNFPIDIIFIRNHKIINLYHDLVPEGGQPRSTYHSGAPVDAVLEIPAGQSRRCNIGVGTEVIW